MTKRNVAITYLRAVAAVAIFVCHLLFISGCFKTSMWFNTGVPLFFIISGFLMAQKRINLDAKGIIAFYCSRIKKLYMPYMVYILAVSAVLLIIRRTPSLSGLIMYLIGCSAFSNNGILGLGHLWFITVILICYLQTPLLQFISEKNKTKNTRGGVSLSSVS